MLERLDTTDYPSVAALLAPSLPNRAFAQGVLDGTLPGQVFAHWVAGRPRGCLLVTGGAFCFLGGEMPGELLEEAFSLLDTKATITLVHPAPRDIEEIASRYGLVATERVQFCDPHPETASARRAAVPEPYRAARIDAALFERLNWRSVVLDIFGSAENYLENHYGFCLMHGDQIAAEAHGVVGGGLVEFGSFTHPEHRRRGLMAIAIDPLVRHGAARGHRAVATCVAGKADSERGIVNAGLQREFGYVTFTRSR